MKLQRYGSATVFLYTFILAACGGGAASEHPPGGGGGMPPMPVEVITLAAKPVERTNEYIGIVKSRRSTTIQPQVEGFVTRITVQPGERVRAGSVLMRIDAGRQEAAVSSLESMRAARQADVQFARQQAERMKKLYDAGAVSQQEYEQAATTVQTSEAQLKAIDAQIREQRVELGYHNVTALTSGIVGDIPVRVGDRVTRQTVLTTIDENAGLELYVSVPVQQAQQGLKPGLLVRLIDDAGAELGTTNINFVSPSVDPATQSVLVKAPLGNAMAFRPDQFLRARIVWSADPGVTVPLVAVVRINAQFFVYVAEPGEGGKTVARQRAVLLGPLVGNDYTVLSGVKEGHQLIVSGIQKIGDGAPIDPKPAASAAPAEGRGGEAR